MALEGESDMSEEKDFSEQLQDKKIPILVLDQKWHRLFALAGKPDNVLQVEAELNELIQHQGQLNNDIKDLKKVKNTLMDSIVANMDETHEENINAMVSKKMEEDRRLIDEVNDKIEAYEDELLEIPTLIRDKNLELMLLTMEFCYRNLKSNTSQIDEIAAWIAQVRKELKRNIIKKQNREINNRQIYSYMHDIFGANVIDVFDLKYEDIEEKYELKPKKKPAAESDTEHEQSEKPKE